MFKLHKGRTKTQYLPVTVSTELTIDELVAFSSGELIAATSSSDSEDIVGVLKQEITSSDDDYADARLVPVEVPLDENTEYEADVTSGLVAADIGKYVDLTDAGTVNRAASSKKVVQVKKVISTTKGIFALNINRV